MEEHREIERKFLITGEQLAKFGFVDIQLTSNYLNIIQGYILSAGGLWVRLRQALRCAPYMSVIGEEYTWTIKGPGGKDRTEYETAMQKQQFDMMWPAFENITISKYRYEIPVLNAKIIHLDIYKDRHIGMFTAEVEFNDIKQCDEYKPEWWFGLEVTDDTEWSNYSMALNKANHIS